MKRSVVILIGLGIVAAAVTYAAGNQGKEEPPDIAALAKKIETLEERVAAIESRQGQTQSPANIVVPPKWPKMQALPEGWQQREFNGLPYYIVPLEPHPNNEPKTTR